eukprot:gene28924-35877_t
MRLRHIEVFHAIMQVGTISGAAQVLHISQPAVTKVLQHCELQLGMPLFERVRGKLYPKPEAHRLFAETEKLNRDLQGIRRLAASLKGRALETIRLVSTPTVAISVLPQAVTAWRKEFPGARCELATHHTSEIVNTLRLGEADLALSLQDPRHPGIVAEPLAQGVMTVIAPAGTWSAADSAMPLTAPGLAGELIGHADNDPLGEMVVAACEAQGLHPVFHTVVQTYQIARSLVEAGGGSTAWVWRDYPVPAGVFKAGRNVIAVRVLSGGSGGGLTGGPENRGIKTSDGKVIALPATWKFQLGMRSKGLSIPPSPWDIPTSLSTLHNAMIAPLAGYKFKLAAWYQGESNTGEPKEYEVLLPLLIADWRKTFAQPELPFLVVQLSSFGSVALKPGASNWAQLREAQARTVRNDRHAGLAVSLDVGDRTDIHPPQKAVLGERLARAARALAYGEAIAPGGPEASGVTRAGEDLVIKFRNAGGGLRTYSASHAIGFEACAGADCRY